METRKIIVVDSSTNSKVTIETNATTFGELKNAVRSTGISVEGKDWLEGITKTAPVSDDSILPSNVNYKGTITNNLVYMLTDTNKKIKSGVTRAELYIQIKENNLNGAIKDKYGKNYTNIPTTILEAFLDDFYAEEEPENESLKKEETCKSCEKQVNYNSLVDAIAMFIVTICNSIPGIGNDIQVATDKIIKDINKKVCKDVDITDNDIDNMFK